MRFHLLIATVMLLGLATTPCIADDGAIRAVGGMVAPMRQHNQVRLLSEFVHAWVSSSGVRVESVFFFSNEGPAVDVAMGFPNSSGGADVEHLYGFNSFYSFVDADTVTTTMLADSLHHSYGDYASWYTKTVPFGDNQIRCIRDVYTSGLGHSAPSRKWFEYTLWTGATWAGTIGAADFVVTFEVLGVPVDSLDIEPKGYKVSGNEIRWHFSDYEPLPGSSLNVGWERHAD